MVWIEYKFKKPNFTKSRWWVHNSKYKSIDLCYSFKCAIQYFLWNCGVSPKIAFWDCKKKKK